MTESKISGKAIALAAAALAVMGVVLIVGGGDEPGGSGDDITGASDSSEPSNDGAETSSDDPLGFGASGNGDTQVGIEDDLGPDGKPTTDPSWTPTPGPTSATEAPTDPPPDPHSHETPSPDEVDAAPPPEFDHDFDIEIDEEIATHVTRLAWDWLKPKLEDEQWSYLELLEYGVLETEDRDGEVFSVAVELGFSGVNGLGHPGIGRINTVWLQVDAATGWKITGYAPAPLTDPSGQPQN